MSLFPAEKGDMFSSPRQIVYTSRQLKILIFDKEINNFEEHLHAKSKHIGIQKKEMYRWYRWRHPMLFAPAMCQRGFLCSVVDKWNVTSMFVNKYLPYQRLVFSKTNCNCNIWSTFLSAFVDLDKFFSFCGAELCLVRAARAARLFFLIQPIKSLFSRVVTIALAVVLA